MPHAQTPHVPARLFRRGPVVHLQAPRASDTAPPRPSISDVVRAAAAVSGVPVEAILSPSRSPVNVRPRHVAMFVAYEIARGASLTTVGTIIGRRDHTTVLNAIHVTRARMAHDPAVADLVRLVRAVALNPSHPVPQHPRPEPRQEPPSPTAPDVHVDLAPPPRPPKQPNDLWLSSERVRRARVLRRRGWSVTGIARYLDADPAVVAVAVGEAIDECVPASARGNGRTA